MGNFKSPDKEGMQFTFKMAPFTAMNYLHIYPTLGICWDAKKICDRQRFGAGGSFLQKLENVTFMNYHHFFNVFCVSCFLQNLLRAQLGLKTFMER